MLQMDLVRRRAGVGDSLGKSFYQILLCLGINCNLFHY